MLIRAAQLDVLPEMSGIVTFRPALDTMHCPRLGQYSEESLTNAAIAWLSIWSSYGPALARGYCQGLRAFTFLPIAPEDTLTLGPSPLINCPQTVSQFPELSDASKIPSEPCWKYLINNRDNRSQPYNCWLLPVHQSIDWLHCHVSLNLSLVSMKGQHATYLYRDKVAQRFWHLGAVHHEMTWQTHAHQHPSTFTQSRTII